jgi:hypothetical protein
VNDNALDSTKNFSLPGLVRRFAPMGEEQSEFSAMRTISTTPMLILIRMRGANNGPLSGSLDQYREPSLEFVSASFPEEVVRKFSVVLQGRNGSGLELP